MGHHHLTNQPTDRPSSLPTVAFCIFLYNAKDIIIITIFLHTRHKRTYVHRVGMGDCISAPLAIGCGAIFCCYGGTLCCFQAAREGKERENQDEKKNYTKCRRCPRRKLNCLCRHKSGVSLNMESGVSNSNVNDLLLQRVDDKNKTA